MLKQASLRIDKDLYKEVRIKLLKQEMSFNTYVNSLIKEDMKKKAK